MFSTYDTNPKTVGPVKVYEVTRDILFLGDNDGYFKGRIVGEVTSETNSSICLRKNKPGGEVNCFDRNEMLRSGRITMGYVKDYTKVIGGWGIFFGALFFQ